MQAISRGVMANVLDFKFLLQSCYDVLFLTNTLVRCMKLPSIGKIVSLLLFYKDGFGI